MGTAYQIKRLLLRPMDGIASLRCTVAEATYAHWEGDGRCRGSLGSVTGIFSGVDRPRNQCPWVVLGTVLILGKSRVSCGVVVALKMSVLGDVGNYST